MSAAVPGRVRYRQIELAGQPVGILSAGPPTAPSVVLLHGFSGDALTWQFTVGALARRYHVIALDLPGHGLTAAAHEIGYWRGMVGWLDRCLGALELTPAHLVGHSLGARILLGAVEEKLLDPRSLTLISCAGISPRYDYAFLDRLTRIATIEDATSCVRHLLGDAPDAPDRLAKGLFQKLSTETAKTNLRAYLSSNFAAGRLLPAAPVPWDSLGVPLQLIWGSDDRIVELPPCDWLPAGAEIHLLDRVGHLPHMVAADRVNALLLAFAERAGEFAQ